MPTTIRVATTPLDCDTGIGRSAFIRLGVTFSPVVDGVNDLASVDVLHDWSRMLQPDFVQFVVQFADQAKKTTLYQENMMMPGSLEPRIRRVYRLAPNAKDLWAALLPSTTAVGARTRIDEQAVKGLRETYSMSQVHAKVVQTYAAGATQSTAKDGTSNRVSAAPAPLTGQALEDFRKFHKIDEKLRAAPPSRIELDVHQRLALLGHYPALMQALGLSIEIQLVVTPEEIDELKGLADKRVRVEPQWQKQNMRPATVDPWTAFLCEPGSSTGQVRFLAANIPSANQSNMDHDRGFLRLGSQSFEVAMIDVVSAVHQLDLQASGGSVPAGAGAPAQMPDDPGLPALRSNGITVFRNDRWDSVVAPRLVRASRLEAKPTVVDQCNETLYADDLVRGYAVDVQTAGGTWVSLCAREARYRIGDHAFPTGTGTVSEEGHIGLTAGRTEDQAKLKVHESLFSWDGWSLAVPPPPCVDADHDSCSPASAKQMNLIVADHAVRCGTLPKLRFGERYRLRARMVDIGGNSLSLEGNGAGSANRHFGVASAASTPDIHFLRAQVPRAPALYAVKDTLSPSSEGPQTHDAATIWFRTGDGKNEYFLAPPPISLEMAISHGLFDPCDVNKFNDEVEAVRERAAAERWSPFFSKDKLPFFPDPTVTGVRVRGLPTQNGKNNGTRVIPFAKPSGTRVILHDATGRQGEYHDVPTGTSELHIYLVPGADVPLLISSCISASGFDLLSAASFVEPATRPSIRTAAMAGMNETLCPPRLVRAIHAVSTPKAPTEVTIKPVRTAFASRAQLSGTIKLDSGQAGTIEFQGTWDEVIDDPNVPLPRTVSQLVGKSSQQSLPTGSPGTVNIVNVDAFHDFTSTAARTVTYQSFVASRYKSFFPGATAVAGPRLQVPVKSSAPPPPPRVISIVPTFGWDAPHHRSGFSLRIYLDRPWFTSGLGEALAVLLPPKGTAIGTVVSKPWYSQWGRDPLWPDGPVSQDLPLVLRPEHFVGRSSALAPSNLSLTTTGGSSDPVEVALYDLEIARNYNMDRRLWFVDMAVDLGQLRANSVYSPFLRLALARYQPLGLAPPEDQQDMRLSTMTTADIIQLTNDRIARMTRSGDQISLFLEGIFPQNADTSMSVVASYQTHDGQGSPDVGWQDPEPAQGAAPDANPGTKKLVFSRNANGGSWAFKEPWALPARNGRLTRIILTEYECYTSSDGRDGAGRRAVYFDIFDL